MKKALLAASLLIAGAITFSACIKKNFDNPPDTSHNDPHLAVTHTIAQLKALNGPYNFHTGGDTTLINDEVVISGIVTADDRSGNVYKSIYIEDSTGAIQVSINQYNLYSDYPVGRKIYIKCKGLLLGYSGGAPILGYTTDETNSIGGIYGAAVDAHIVKADVGHTVTPTHVTLAQLTGFNFNNPASTNLLNRLIMLDSVQFKNTSFTYTQPNGSSIDRYIGDCGHDSVEVYTSNYADFAQHIVPAGRGNFAAIFTIYTSTVSGRVSPEVIVRDESDIQLGGPRCSGSSGGGGGGGGATITIFSQDFSGLTNNADIALAGWTNTAVTGSVKWKSGTAGSGGTNPFAKISAYQTGQASVVSWLVTPAINVAGHVSPVLTFKNTDGYDDGATLQAYISTNFNGNPATATWTSLPVTISSGHASSYGSFLSSGNIDLSSYTAGSNGTVYIGFKYTGADPASGKRTTTFEIDDVKVISY